MGYRVLIDKEGCQSSGRCVAAAPEAFALDEDHLATLLPGGVVSDALLLTIARGCPALAIRLVDEGGREAEL